MDIHTVSVNPSSAAYAVAFQLALQSQRATCRRIAAHKVAMPKESFKE